MNEAMRCRLCEKPSCTEGEKTDIRGIMRRVAVGNFAGARKRWLEMPADQAALARYETNCVCSHESGEAVRIKDMIAYISGVEG